MKITCIIILQLLLIIKLYSQVPYSSSVYSTQKEIYFSFNIDENKIPLKILSSQISIDKIKGNIVYAYSTPENFNNLKNNLKELNIIKPEFASRNIPMAKSLKDVLTWNYYPTYSQYEQLITNFINNYPEICTRENFGISVNGRNLWVIKISDNVLTKEAEPEFLYSATIHGNEPLGYLLSLRLIDYLLSNYNSDPEITELINNHEIWINPLANPDGTYAGGDNTIIGATRFNANGVDLNRNFPDPEEGTHPDGKTWQPENIAMMNFVERHNFVISANLHTGSEVVNYPWDTWPKLHTDDAWFQKVARQFADTCQYYSPIGYFDDYNNGITNGYQWYTISGGTQDYMTYFQNSRNFTLELSSTHLIDTSLLSNYWEYNYRSLIDLINSCNLGINGIVTDSLTGLPIKAKIEIIAHDFDNSFVYSDSLNGDFYRPIIPGTYSIIVSALNHYSCQIDNIVLSENESKFFEIKLAPIKNTNSHLDSFNSIIVTNPVNDFLKIRVLSSKADYLYINIFSSEGKELYYNEYFIQCNSEIEINIDNFANGIYYLMINQNQKKNIYKVFKK